MKKILLMIVAVLMSGASFLRKIAAIYAKIKYLSVCERKKSLIICIVG